MPKTSSDNFGTLNVPFYSEKDLIDIRRRSRGNMGQTADNNLQMKQEHNCREHECDHGLNAIYTNSAMKEFYSGPSPNLHLDLLPAMVESVLDIGCGLCRTILPFVGRARHITGLDPLPEAMEECRKRLRGAPVTLINEEFRKNLFRPKSFDVVVAYNSIYHGTKAQMLDRLNEIYRLLLPGGYFLLTVKSLTPNSLLFAGAHEIEANTWIYTKMPDGDVPHHFSDKKEQKYIEGMFSRVLLREKIHLIRKKRTVVQAAGFYYVLKK